ncbi:MAG: glycosyltransferase family 2 protein [Muribaculaceae bacterium]|nr:glycosyltransferase family 2 protein [Muribaculaceae bacterium]
MAKISIIVPVYNTAKYLERCIDSIVAQTYTDWELLLIDDGSTDRSGDICDRYAASDPRIQAFHKPNGGLTSARNHGLERASGEWITHIDSDDWVEPEMLAKMLAKAEESDADVVIGDFYFAWDDQRKLYQSIDWDDDKTASLNRYIASVWTTAWGSIAKRSLYIDNNIKSPEGITYCEDFHLMVRLCYFAKHIAHLKRPLYNYWQQQESLMHNKTENAEKDSQHVYLDIVQFFKNYGVYADYRRTLCWRMISTYAETVLNVSYWDDFRRILPEKRHFICSHPYINAKLKLNMWCLTHHLSLVSHLMLWARKIKHHG